MEFCRTQVSKVQLANCLRRERIRGSWSLQEFNLLPSTPVCLECGELAPVGRLPSGHEVLQCALCATSSVLNVADEKLRAQAKLAVKDDTRNRLSASMSGINAFTSMLIFLSIFVMFCTKWRRERTNDTLPRIRFVLFPITSI